MVHGVGCRVEGAWCMVYSAWCRVCMVEGVTFIDGKSGRSSIAFVSALC